MEYLFSYIKHYKKILLNNSGKNHGFLCYINDMKKHKDNSPFFWTHLKYWIE